jgi:hypothetical protein
MGHKGEKWSKIQLKTGRYTAKVADWISGDTQLVVSDDVTDTHKRRAGLSIALRYGNLV